MAVSFFCPYGLEIATAEPGPIVMEVRISGIVSFNEAKLARLAASVSGNVRQVLKNVGDVVAKRDELGVTFEQMAKYLRTWEQPSR